METIFWNKLKKCCYRVNLVTVICYVGFIAPFILSYFCGSPLQRTGLVIWGRLTSSEHQSCADDKRCHLNSFMIKVVTLKSSNVLNSSFSSSKPPPILLHGKWTLGLNSLYVCLWYRHFLEAPADWHTFCQWHSKTDISQITRKWWLLSEVFPRMSPRKRNECTTFKVSTGGRKAEKICGLKLRHGFFGVIHDIGFLHFLWQKQSSLCILVVASYKLWILFFSPNNWVRSSVTPWKWWICM